MAKFTVAFGKSILYNGKRFGYFKQNLAFFGKITNETLLQLCVDVNLEQFGSGLCF